MSTRERESHKPAVMEIDVFANKRICLKTHRRNLHSLSKWIEPYFLSAGSLVTEQIHRHSEDVEEADEDVALSNLLRDGAD